MMVHLCVMECGELWFGVAHHGAELVATSASPDRERTLAELTGSLPAGIPHRLVDEASAFAAETVRLLAALEAGREEGKRFTLSRRYVPEPLRSVLCIAACIPRGYVTTYGNIAAATGTEARVVGNAMAGNPLYPIVPCHRVVGYDLSLVGYGRRQDADALRAKLKRLRAEARGFTQEAVAPGTSLEVYPVEWAIARARRDGVGAPRQLTLFG
jgi:O-6-methylguanine DNA methyltransferase